MNLRPALAALLLAPLLLACASTSKVMLSQARPAIDPALVQVYASPPEGSIEIAQIEATSAAGFGTQGQTDAAIARLKREAAALGANGVVLMGVGSQRAPVSVGVLTRVRRSLPDTPLSDAAASASVAGLAGALVSMVKAKSLDTPETLPAASVARAVSVCAPSASVLLVIVQAPEPSAVALPRTVAPSES